MPKTTLKRRLALAAVCAASCLALFNTAKADEPITLVTSFRSLDNPYSALWAKGGKDLAAFLGANVSFKVLASGANNQAQLTSIQSLLASTPGKVVMVIDPNTNSITQAVVQAVQRDPNAYAVVFWNKPADLWPWNGYSHWVSFISFNGTVSGEQTADVLFNAMGNKGGIIALQGILDNIPAKQRFAGLQAALGKTPAVKLLGQETANWSQTQAFTVTQTLLAKYGDHVNGIWAANDDMALGALQALKAANLAGKIPVVSASDATPQVLQDISSGAGILATTNADGYWDASAGLALGYYAATGKLDVSTLPHDKRAFYAKAALITKDNVSGYLAAPDPKQYSKGWVPNNLFNRWQAPLQ